MYFSLITPLEGHEREAIHQRLNGPYADHQWLWRCFPAEPGAPRDFIFRRKDRDGLPHYYVVSHRVPLEISRAWKIQTRTYAPQVVAGERFHFDLRANPTVRHKHDGKAKRHDVVMDAKKRLLTNPQLIQSKNWRDWGSWGDWVSNDQAAPQEIILAACCHWLLQRGKQLGFAPDLGTLGAESYEQHQQGKAQKDKILQFSTIEFTGTLTVTDRQAFESALITGIGSSKAFGCGLMLIRRPTTDGRYP